MRGMAVVEGKAGGGDTSYRKFVPPETWNEFEGILRRRKRRMSQHKIKSFLGCSTRVPSDFQQKVTDALLKEKLVTLIFQLVKLEFFVSEESGETRSLAVVDYNIGDRVEGRGPSALMDKRVMVNDVNGTRVFCIEFFDEAATLRGYKALNDGLKTFNGGSSDGR